MHSSKANYTTDPSRLEFLSHKGRNWGQIRYKGVLFSIAFWIPAARVEQIEINAQNNIILSLVMAMHGNSIYTCESM